jgi:hypothetical protein
VDEHDRAPSAHEHGSHPDPAHVVGGVGVGVGVGWRSPAGWVEHDDAPLQAHLPIRLVLLFRRCGTLTADAIVVADDGDTVTLDLRRSPHAWARAEEGQGAALLRRRDHGLEMADTRVVHRAHDGNVLQVAAPDGWRRLPGGSRTERRVPVDGVLHADGVSRRLVGETRDLSAGQGVRTSRRPVVDVGVRRIQCVPASSSHGSSPRPSSRSRVRAS